MLEVLTRPNLSAGKMYSLINEQIKVTKTPNEILTCLNTLGDMQDTEATHNILNHFSYTFLTVLDLEQLEQLKFKTDLHVTSYKVKQKYLIVFSGTLKTIKITVVDFLTDPHLHSLGHDLRQYFIKENMSFLWKEYRTKRDQFNNDRYYLTEDKKR